MHRDLPVIQFSGTPAASMNDRLSGLWMIILEESAMYSAYAPCIHDQETKHQTNMLANWTMAMTYTIC
jgi:hypothetical protein